MRRAASILLIGFILLLVVASALATDKVVDIYDRDAGTGKAVIYVEDNIYFIIFYKDVDGSGDYTPGDTIIRIYRSKLLP